MRWNCPHCGINLAVSDDKLANGWSFSRCYKCAGYAMVRRSDVNLIKVDRAPTGEQVLLPEGHEDPTALLSQNAANNLARYINNGGTRAQAEVETLSVSSGSVAGADKPRIRPATRRSQTVTAQPPQFQKQQQQQTPPKFTPLNPGVSFGHSIPEPLPEHPVTGLRQRMLPAAIGLTGLMAIGSGVFLYIQGQALFAKARAQASADVSALALASAPAPAQAVESNEIVEAPNLLGTSSLAAANALARLAANPGAEVADQVHSNAMAPTRDVPAQTISGSVTPK